MQNDSRIIMNSLHPRPAKPFTNRPRQWASNGDRLERRGFQKAQKSYERYLELAQAQVQAGDMVGAENYYQHAEHYFRSMSADREASPRIPGTRGADEKHDR